MTRVIKSTVIILLLLIIVIAKNKTKKHRFPFYSSNSKDTIRLISALFFLSFN